MDSKKFGNFNWIEMDSKDQNLNLTRTKQIHLYPFQFILFAGHYVSSFWIMELPRRGAEHTVSTYIFCN